MSWVPQTSAPTSEEGIEKRANAAGHVTISEGATLVTVLALATNEEQVIVRHVGALI